MGTHYYTLHSNIKKQTLYTINLHINYTLDKYTIHFTYTLFILNIYTIYINNKTYTFQFKHNLYTTFHYHTHYYTLHSNIKKQTLYTINLHINYTLGKYTIHFTYTYTL